MKQGSLPRWNTAVAHPAREGAEAHARFLAKIKEAPPTAVLVFHGVGEEVRYDTLGRAAAMILTEAEENHGATDLEFVSRTVLKDENKNAVVARGELSWMEEGNTKRQVHVYEAYWAPLTVGKVTYLETVLFLLSAGWNGLTATFRGKTFQRWLFGGFESLRIASRTPALIIVLMFLVGFVAAIIAMGASAVAGVAKAAASGQGTRDIYLAANYIYHQVSVPWNGFLHFTQWAVAGATRGTLHAEAVKNLSFRPDLTLQLWRPAIQVAIALIVWGGLIYLAYFLRFFLVQYAGSLVAYLSPYKDSKWEKLRSEIQKVGIDAARVVHDGHAFSDWIPEYERIVYLGHSLGSVIAYDTLNAMINIQAGSRHSGERNPVVHRTRALITFGSPLDKTAFLFRVQLKLKSWQLNAWRHALDNQGLLRETMVSAVQPLITSYEDFRFIQSPMRGINWINVWSSRDIISGSLDYYDDPKEPQNSLRHVQNLVDPDAWIPLAAHIQYWSKPTLRRVLYDELF